MRESMASMKVAVLFIASLLALQRQCAHSEGKAKCKGSPKVVGACYSVHGRLNTGADTIQLRLWPVGTKRMLGVSDGPAINDAESPLYPNTIRFPNGDETIYGDFEVCPFTPKREGEMQFVCIESASHLVMKR
jgi:hypothetical protein